MAHVANERGLCRAIDKSWLPASLPTQEETEAPRKNTTGKVDNKGL